MLVKIQWLLLLRLVLKWSFIIPLFWILTIIWILLLCFVVVIFIETRLVNAMTSTSCSICLMKWWFFWGFFSFNYLLTLIFIILLFLIILFRYFKEMHLTKTRLLLSSFINNILALLYLLLLSLLLNWFTVLFRYLRDWWKLRWFTVLAFIAMQLLLLIISLIITPFWIYWFLVVESYFIILVLISK